MARSWVLLFAMASRGFAAGSVALPFENGFEESPSFSAWTTLANSGSNSILQSQTQAFSGTHSLEARYSGSTANPAAAPVVDFASTTSIFVRFWLFIPAGSASQMKDNDYIRLVRLANATTAMAGGGDSAVRLWLNASKSTGLWLDLDYNNVGNRVTAIGSAQTTRVSEGRWFPIAISYEPAVPRAQLFIDDLVVPKAVSTAADMPLHAFQTFWLGIANSASTAGQLSFFFDNVTLAKTSVPVTNQDAGPSDASVGDAGMNDAGVDGGVADGGSPDANATGSVDSGAPINPSDGLNDAGASVTPVDDNKRITPVDLTVGCQCQNSESALAGLLMLWLLTRKRHPAR